VERVQSIENPSKNALKEVDGRKKKKRNDVIQIIKEVKGRTKQRKEKKKVEGRDRRERERGEEERER
jgi:hypothetical protein